MPQHWSSYILFLRRFGHIHEKKAGGTWEESLAIKFEAEYFHLLTSYKLILWTELNKMSLHSEKNCF